jgi:hypothetical protein
VKGKLIWAIFWALAVAFVIIIVTMQLPSSAAWRPLVFLIACIALVALGVILIVLSVRRKLNGAIRSFLLLTGAAAVALPVAIVLHNVVSIEEPVFFILATVVCPIGFLVGFVGTIVIAIRRQTA